jgi:hypothetical protein
MTPRILALIFGACAVLQSAAQTVNSVITNRLAEPYNIAVDANTYYISDSANSRIVKFVPDTGVFSTLAGFAGRPGFVDNTNNVYARFSDPRGLISVPSRGGLVVADYANHVLRLVAPTTGFVTTIAGTPGVPGLDAGPTPALSAHFNFPSALAADTNGNIFIADSKNNVIRKLDPSNTITTVATGLTEPSGLAIGDNGDLWIADSRNHTIKRLTSDGIIHLEAGTPGQSGALDSIFANETLFNDPTALLWLGASGGLLICDTGNHTVRRVYSDPEIIGYSVETFAGSPTFPGYVDGPALQAKFNSPSGIVKNPDGGFLVADLANNAVRGIQTSAPLPPVSDPTIGYVIFIKDSFGELLSHLVSVNGQLAIFNNDVNIQILSEAATSTYFTYGPTPSSSLEDTIPSPSPLTGTQPQPYTDGLHSDQVPPSIISPQPDVTIKAIGIADTRRPSDVVQARFEFKTANPAIFGDNAASFVVTNITQNAQMFYTVDGSNPTTNSTPVSVGTLSLPRSATNVTFQIRAFRNGYSPSEIVTKVFEPENFQANRITFGFEDGEASSEFVGAAGQTFFAPVTLTLLPNQTMYSLQFSVTAAALTGPAVSPGAVGFASMLEYFLGNNLYQTIPPAMLTNVVTGQFGSLLTTNTTANLLSIGWLERAGKTNLYDTTKQDLITYSMAHDNVFLSKDQKTIVGGYSFTIPSNAVPGQQYVIEIDRPSATADGIYRDVLIEAPTNGPTGPGPINARKYVTVGSTAYIVGDVAPFRWFNAGDFGDGLLLNNDVMQVFQSAIYFLNQPPAGSDFFDAMDASDGSVSQIYSGDDTAINKIKYGDGSLNVDDVYVTFRRSLDPSLTWYARYWSNGVLQSVAATNTFRGAPDLPGQSLSSGPPPLPASSFIAGDPSVTFAVDDLIVNAGQTLQIPVRSTVIGSYPLRVLMLNLTAEPLDGSPPITAPVTFTPVAALADPTLTSTRSLENFAGAWLNSQVAGVAGASTVGTLTVTIPTNAPTTAAYRMHFDHASGSPNGLGLFPKKIQDGLLTLSNRSGSSLGDGIPDSWRLRYFGSISNALAQATADPDGDGVSNWAEYKAGTNPMDPNSSLKLGAHGGGNGSAGAHGLTLQWLTTAGKNYVVESASSLTSPTWTAIGSTIAGTGQELQFTPPVADGAAQFFRVRLAE